MSGISLLGSREYEGRSEEDEILVNTTKDSINRADFFLITVNSLIGIGPLRLSRRFECGIVLTSIINLLTCLLLYYANWMLLKIGSLQKTFSYATSWAVSIGKYAYIPSIMAIIPSIPFIAWFIINISYLIIPMVNSLWSSKPFFVTDIYVLAVIISLIFALPTILDPSLFWVRMFSYISMITLILALGGQVGNFIREIQYNGFNPRNELSMWNMEGDILGAFTEFIGCYTAFVYTFQIMKNTRKVTLKTSRRTLGWSFAFCYLYYEIFGIIGYMTVWNNQKGQLILDVLSHTSLINVMRVLMAIKVGCTIPVFLNAVRDNALEIVKEMKRYPTVIFVCSGMIIILTSIIFASLHDRYLSVMNSMLNFCVMLIGFVIPAIILMKMKQKLTWFQKTMCVVCIVLGSCFALYNILGLFI